ncbi:MAG: trigger factor [Candidatus Margulisiibacteriota bacterium]|jgi:trigger factor
MKILEKKRENNQFILKIEEDYAEVVKKSADLFKTEVHKYRIPGFRPGKAPRNVFEQHFGKGFLLEKAVNEVISDCYVKAVEQEKLQPVDYPKDIEVEQFDENKPVVFKFALTVSPEVQLKKFKGLSAEKKTVAVNEADLDKRLDEVRESLAEYIEVKRPAQKEDIVRYDLKAMVENTPIAAFTKTNQGTRIGINGISPEFDEQLIGINYNETKSFQLSFPADHHHLDLKGKTVDFSVLLTEIREKQLPALDDSFAQKVSEFKTIEELKTKMKEAMVAHAESEADAALKEALIAELVKANPIDIPEVMINRQIDSFIEKLKHSISEQKLDWETYLKYANKTPENIRKEYQEPAQRRVAADLLLQKLIETEKLEIPQEELEKELGRIAEQELKQPLDKVRDQLRQSEPYIQEYLLINKAVDLIVSNAKIKKGGN